MNEWISVEDKDKLPRIDSVVLVYRPELNENYENVDMVFFCINGADVLWEDHDGYPVFPTHWMPLPDPPTELEDGSN